MANKRKDKPAGGAASEANSLKYLKRGKTTLASAMMGSRAKAAWPRHRGSAQDVAGEQRLQAARPHRREPAATARQAKKEGDRRLREAGWIPTSEKLPPLGEVIQDVWVEPGPGRVVPFAAKFPPDDVSTVRRESEVVLALVEEDWDAYAGAMRPVFHDSEPRLYQYIEYMDGRKMWDDWSHDNDYRAVFRPTHWRPLPGGVGALPDAATGVALLRDVEAEMRARGGAPARGASSAWISVTEQLPPLGEVEGNDPGVPSEGTRRESQVVAVLILAPSCDRMDRQVAEPRLAKYVVMSNGDRYWQNYSKDDVLQPTHWFPLPQGSGMMARSQRLGGHV